MTTTNKICTYFGVAESGGEIGALPSLYFFHAPHGLKILVVKAVHCNSHWAVMAVFSQHTAKVWPWLLKCWRTSKRPSTETLPVNVVGKLPNGDGRPFAIFHSHTAPFDPRLKNCMDAAVIDLLIDSAMAFSRYFYARSK